MLGGGPAKRPECGEGWFVEPTIFTSVNNEMRIAQEEVFGPVLSVIRFKDEDDAVRIANDGASVSPRASGRRDLAARIRVVGAHPSRHRMGEHLSRR